MEEANTAVVVVLRTKHRIVFDVRNVPPKWCIALRAAIRYAVPTMSSSLCVVSPKTNTVMDYMWWTNRISQLALESSHADEFSYADECDKCEAGGRCCEAKLTLAIWNKGDDDLPVYTDDIISSDTRVLLVHRSFSVLSLFNTPEGVGVETDLVHSFSDGDLVTVLDSVCQPPLPKWVRAVKCGEKSLVLENLFADQPTLQITENINFQIQTDMVAHISKRQLLYTLKPGGRVSFSATVRKGTGRDGTKWTPVGGLCSYRPLFRDLKVNNKLLKTEKQKKELVASCPKKVFDIEDFSRDVVVANADDCNGCERCTRWAKDRGLQNHKIPHVGCDGPSQEKKMWRLPNQCEDCGLQIETESAVEFPKKRLFEWHRFTVETNGSLDAADAVEQALAILQSRLAHKAEAAGAQPKEFPALK